MTRLAYYLTKVVCWLFFRLGFWLEVSGGAHVPKRGAFILASNHVSYLDPPVVGVACPRRLVFMARADLFDQALLGMFLRAVGAIALKREGGDVAAIRMALEELRDGRPVAIFPEGGRQPGGALGTAKRGVGLLAVTAQVPIVPALVRGTFDAWPPHARRLRRRKIHVAFGPPIPYTDFSFSTTASGPRPALGERRGGRARRSQHEQRLAEAVTLAWQRLAAQRQPAHPTP